MAVVALGVWHAMRSSLVKIDRVGHCRLACAVLLPPLPPYFTLCDMHAVLLVVL